MTLQDLFIGISVLLFFWQLAIGISILRSEGNSRIVKIMGMVFCAGVLIINIAPFSFVVNARIYESESTQCLSSLPGPLPSYQSIQSFLATDTTNEIKYRDYRRWFGFERGFVCGDFARTLVKNARNNNLPAYVVKVEFISGEGHAIVCFDTNEGRVFIEPQEDKRLELEIGKTIIYGRTVKSITVFEKLEF